MTLTATMNVSLADGHDLLVFAFRQCVIERGMLLQNAGGQLVQTAITLEPLADNSVALKVTSDAVNIAGDYIVIVDYEGLRPVFVRSASSEDKDIGALTAEDLPGQRSKLIEQHFDELDPLRTYAEQWAKFDAKTDASVSGSGMPAQTRVRALLLSRAARRGAWAQLGKPLLGDNWPTDLTASTAVAGQFRDALKVFSHDGNTLDLVEFKRSFIAFTCGRLAFGNLTAEQQEYRFLGVPDGAMYVLFAEAAIGFAKDGPDGDMWLELARLFVGCTSTFLDAYWQPGRTHRTRNHYVNSPLRHPINEARLRQQLGLYSSMSLEDLGVVFGKMVSAAFIDERQRIEVDQGSATRGLDFEVLERTDGVQGNPDTFKPAGGSLAKKIREQVECALGNLRIKYCDDVEEQHTQVKAYVQERVGELGDLEEHDCMFAIDHDECERSTYDPDTGLCKIRDSGGSWRWCLKHEDPKHTDKPTLEVIVGTPRIPEMGGSK